MSQILYSPQVQSSNGHRRQTLPAWMRRHLFPTDGPDSGKVLRLERWQALFLKAVEFEKKPIISLRAASQVGKTLLALGVGLRAAVDGRGVLLASATEVGARDLSRRVEGAIERSPYLAKMFPSARSGPGARASWKDRRLAGGGWLGMAAAGSASQLASRTAAVAIADEVSRWPRSVRSGEGHPLTLLRQRLSDWGNDGRLIAISSPVLERDAISLLFRDGDRRALMYPCLECCDLTPFLWEQVVGRERGETVAVTCLSCGVPHGEDARRKMLRKAEWIAQREDPTDEASISFGLSRLDSARASLGQVVQEWRRARLGVERGDPNALRAFRNLCLGLPGSQGSADVDKLFELRQSEFQLATMEQVTAGVDCQSDRLVYVVLGFAPDNLDCWVLDYGVFLGDPREDSVWETLAAKLSRPFGGLPASVVSVDAGYLTSTVQAQCARRRWWVPCVGRSGQGKPLARRLGPTGIATLGKDDANSWWSGRVETGDVHFPRTILRTELAEIAASEVLTAEGGALRWRPIDGVPNHLWDSAILAVHGRHFRTLSARRRPFGLVAV